MAQMLPRTQFSVERNDYSGLYYHNPSALTAPVSIVIPMTIPPGFGLVRAEGRMRAGSSYFSGVSGSFNIYFNNTSGSAIASGSCPATGDNGFGGASDPGGFNGLATWESDPSNTGQVLPIMSSSVSAIAFYFAWGGSLSQLFGNPWRLDYWLAPIPRRGTVVFG